MLRCFEQAPFFNEKSELLKAVIDRIERMVVDETSEDRLRDRIGRALVQAQTKFLPNPNALEILRACEDKMPGIFDNDPELAFAKLEMAQSDEERMEVLHKLLKGLPATLEQQSEHAFRAAVYWIDAALSKIVDSAILTAAQGAVEQCQQSPEIAASQEAAEALSEIIDKYSAAAETA
jgi:hypothetical protein